MVSRRAVRANEQLPFWVTRDWLVLVMSIEKERAVV
jgi:hypothetical protein